MQMGGGQNKPRFCQGACRISHAPNRHRAANYVLIPNYPEVLNLTEALLWYRTVMYAAASWKHTLAQRTRRSQKIQIRLDVNKGRPREPYPRGKAGVEYVWGLQ